MSGTRKALCLILGALLLLSLPAPAHAQKKTLVVGAQPGSGHPGSHAVPHLRRAHHLRADVREALRDRREPEASIPSSPPRCRRSPTAARRSRSSSARREVQRRHADERRGGEVLARPAPRDEGLQPAQRAGVGRPRSRSWIRSRSGSSSRRRSPAHGAARRPRRHAGVADRGQEARRQVRDRAGVRGAVGVRGARGPGPHRAREVHPLLRSGRRPSSTGSSSASSPTTTCGWPTCARATSTSCTRCARPTPPASRRRAGSRSPA